MSLNIVDYSEKAIAVFGDSTQYKVHLLNLNGKYNPSLRQNDQRQAGWIFPKTKKSEVEKLINQINNGTITASDQPTEHKEYKEKVDKKYTEKEYVSKQDFMNLVSKVERLEQEYNNLLKIMGKNPSKQTKKESSSEEEPEEDEESEEEKPKRLLRKK
jgi:hypothetical protein